MKKHFLKKEKRQSGFTLVEMILYMGLLSLLLVLFMNIFLAILDTQLSAESTSSVTQEGRFIYSRLIYDINRASSVSLPANLGDSGNVLQLQINGIIYRYELVGGNLQVTEGSTSSVLNNYDTTISGLQFQRIGNPNGKHTFKITYTVTAKTQLHGAAESQNFQTTAGLR